MVFCRYCGKALNDGDRVCPYCGRAVDSSSANTPVPKNDSNMTKLNVVLSVILVIVMIIATVAFLIPPAENDTPDYKVTVTIDSFYVLDASGQLDPDDRVAEIYFVIECGTLEEIENGTYSWNSRDSGTWNVSIYDADPALYFPQSGSQHSFNTDTNPDDLYFTIFMLDFDTLDNDNEAVSDTIDLYTPDTIVGAVPEYAGFSGVLFNLESFETSDNEYVVELVGDSAPIGYVKLTITITEQS
ncbi:MAG: zinc ribbon domain-containing protein [Candidatus Methanomethylophilaceae archaeon]